jgi:FKBP-type peptidyl-prolyl cis-trans isomerase FkpA
MRMTIVALLAPLALLSLLGGCGAGDKGGSAANTPATDAPSRAAQVTEAPRTEAPPSELVITDLQLGTGPAIASGARAVVQYTGWLYDAGAPEHKGRKLDSSRDRNEPFDFPLGGGHVIKGWDQGVMGMKVGGQRRLVIPPALAYGEKDAGGVIPPNATLVFDVELVGIK